MPKKQKRTEQEIREQIVRDAKIRLGCSEFEPDFTLHHVELTNYPAANWDVQSVRGAEGWKPDCAQAFKEAIARARRKFDIAWA